MESVETQFEEVLVAKSKGAGEQAAYFSVDAFHYSRLAHPAACPPVTRGVAYLRGRKPSRADRDSSLSLKPEVGH
jgi:hypothetical protein